MSGKNTLKSANACPPSLSPPSRPLPAIPQLWDGVVVGHCPPHGQVIRVLPQPHPLHSLPPTPPPRSRTPAVWRGSCRAPSASRPGGMRPASAAAAAASSAASASCRRPAAAGRRESGSLRRCTRTAGAPQRTASQTPSSRAPAHAQRVLLNEPLHKYHHLEHLHTHSGCSSTNRFTNPIISSTCTRTAGAPQRTASQIQSSRAPAHAQQVLLNEPLHKHHHIEHMHTHSSYFSTNRFTNPIIFSTSTRTAGAPQRTASQTPSSRASAHTQRVLLNELLHKPHHLEHLHTHSVLITQWRQRAAQTTRTRALSMGRPSPAAGQSASAAAVRRPSSARRGDAAPATCSSAPWRRRCVDSRRETGSSTPAASAPSSCTDTSHTTCNDGKYLIVNLSWHATAFFRYILFVLFCFILFYFVLFSSI